MKKNILSINGNKPMNYLLQTVLSERYKFTPVSDVFQGVNELKKKEEIDLIIIDVDYYTQESWDFVQHIKTSSLYQHKPVIALISKETEKENNNAGRLMVDEFFKKPFSPLDLIKTIDELMSVNVLKNL